MIMVISTLSQHNTGYYPMKQNLMLTFLFSLSLTACGGGGGDGDGGSGGGGGTYTGVPYDYEDYQQALDNANLQQTNLSDCEDGDIDEFCSKSDVEDAGGYDNYESEYFYIDSDSGWLTFAMSGDSNRTELRFIENFKTNSDNTQYTLSAEVLPINPTNSVANSVAGEAMTLLQVHNKGTSGESDETVLSHPLLRIIWDGESRTEKIDGVEASSSYENAYWAIIKTNALECDEGSSSYDEAACDSTDSYDFHYLGDYDANNATKFEIIVGNEQLTINVDDDDEQQVDVNIAYWADLYSYFKAGVYNQYSNGNSVVQFKTLKSSILTELPMNENLSGNDAPSSNFDLTRWYLSVPIDRNDGDDYERATDIKEDELNAGYQLDDYFYTAADGGMVFKDYIGGAITSENTSYSRTELREMLRAGDTDIDTQGVNENNWVFSTAPSDQLERAGGIDGTMIATLAVNHVTFTGTVDDQIGRVIVGQIHAASDEPIRLYYRLLPGHNKGSIYFAHEPSNGNTEQWYEMIGSRDSNATEPADGIELDEKFTYKIEVLGNTMTVSIIRFGKSTVTEVIDMSDSGYDGHYEKDGEQTEDYMYFKAGVYNQNNSGDDSDYVQATFYYLNHEHY